MTKSASNQETNAATGQLGARVQNFLKGDEHFWSRVVLTAIVAFALLAAFLVFIYAPEIKRAYFHLNPKPGFIFVESPEVYTRERLINERLSEDAWLHNELGRADEIRLFPANVMTRKSKELEARTGTRQKPVKPIGEGDKDSVREPSSETARSQRKPPCSGSYSSSPR